MKAFLITAIVLVFVVASYGQQSTYTIQQYLNIKSASSPAFSPDGKTLAYLSNASGTTQVWTVGLDAGTPRQLTKFDDNVSFVRWLANGELLFGKAKGGDENTQFLLMKADGTGIRALTDKPAVRHNFGVLSSDSRTIAYASNKRDRNYFDIYKMDLATGREELVYQQDGSNSVAAMRDDGRKFIVSRDGIDLSLDNNLYLVDPAAKQEILLTPHTGAAEFDNAEFTADGIVFTHNDKREFIGLAQLRQKNAAGDDWSAANLETTIIDGPKWDVTDVVMEQSGGKIAYAVNRDGFSELFIRRMETDGKPLITVVDKKAEPIRLPAKGIVGGMTFNSDQSKLAFAYMSAISPPDVWVYDLATKILKRVTSSDTAGVARETFVEPRLIKYRTFDGLEIPAWYYEPLTEKTKRRGKSGDDTIDIPIVSQGTATTRPVSGPVSRTEDYRRSIATYGDGRSKVIVSVHGGPEGQERPGFNALYQYYLSRGYAILATNVRGSTGYGKTFTHLDDVRKREDSVKDLAYAVEWLTKFGHADPKRIAIMGGSYGGYMTLAAITLYPEIWAAAVDTVGIANWESFLRNTSGYRRRQREVEYGRLDRDLDFLRSISPLAKVDRIKAPLFVIAGRNDPRVPYTEAEQIVGAIRGRGGVVEYKIYDDEGHGVSKLKNRIDLYPLVADFLDKNMKK